MRFDLTRPLGAALLLATTILTPTFAVAQTAINVFSPQTATMDLNTAWFTRPLPLRSVRFRSPAATIRKRSCLSTG
jgi:hypothetical protein